MIEVFAPLPSTLQLAFVAVEAHIAMHSTSAGVREWMPALPWLDNEGLSFSVSRGRRLMDLSCAGGVSEYHLQPNVHHPFRSCVLLPDDSKVVEVFTDGSFRPGTRRSSWAVVAPALSARASSGLIVGVAKPSAFLAELIAIANALVIIAVNVPLLVYTDCKAAIAAIHLAQRSSRTIRSRLRSSGWPVLELIRALLELRTRNGGPVSFQHIEAHVGHEYNEAADQAAKSASSAHCVPLASLTGWTYCYQTIGGKKLLVTDDLVAMSKSMKREAAFVSVGMRCGLSVELVKKALNVVSVCDARTQSVILALLGGVLEKRELAREVAVDEPDERRRVEYENGPRLEGR